MACGTWSRGDGRRPATSGATSTPPPWDRHRAS